MAIRSGLIGALLVLALWGLRWGSPLEEGPRTVLLQDVGMWLGHYRPGPKLVMAMHAQVPYYSQGTLLLMPYADGSRALSYVHLKHPDFIVLVEEDRFVAPYINQWLKDGIPDRAAVLIYQANGVAIYEWHG
jgi:hypothetical protein